MSRTKKSKAVPVVVVLTILLAALAIICFLINPLVIQPQKDAIAKANQEAREAVIEENKKIDAEYRARLSELESKSKTPTNPSWPSPKENTPWELMDLSQIPLEHPTAVSQTRADLATGGMLLVNEWHARPEDIYKEIENQVVSVAKRFQGDQKLQAKDNNVTLFPVAVDALQQAVAGAKAAGYTHYLVEEGYRTFETQQGYFTKKTEKLASKYKGDALIAAAKKEVNEPGHSEYNTGLSFDLRLYDRNDPDVATPKYSTTPEGKWMNENCWRYGIVFRFPQAGWPLETSTDKSFKTGVSMHLNLYRYVGKGNAAIMHFMDFTLEEYIEYLQEHPHIALFVDGVLKYEVYRQAIGNADPINVQLTGNTKSFESSLDNMGAIITVFNHDEITDEELAKIADIETGNT